MGWKPGHNEHWVRHLVIIGGSMAKVNVFKELSQRELHSEGGAVAGAALGVDGRGDPCLYA